MALGVSYDIREREIQRRRIAGWVEFYANHEDISQDLVRELLTLEAEYAEDFIAFCRLLAPKLEAWKEKAELERQTIVYKLRRLMPRPYKPPW